MTEEKKSWVQVLKHGLNKGFRNPKKEAEFAENKANEERLAELVKIRENQVKTEKYWSMKRAKRMDRDEKEYEW